MARIQGKTTTELPQHFAGIDVSKAYLDIRLPHERRAHRFTNDPAGFAALAAHLGGASHLIVLEPTGRYHHAIWKALAAAGHQVAPINPLHVRRFAESEGELSKTDALDAAVLARMAVERQPEAKAPPGEEQLRIKELTTSLADRIDRRAMLKAGRKGLRGPLIAKLDEAEIDLLNAAIDTLKAEIAGLIEADPARARSAEILVSIPGIGVSSAHRIIADMPEIGTLNDKQAGALLGAAPRACESGKRKNRRRTKGGRRHLRAALHMPAIAAARANPDLKAFRQRLKARGKPGAVITTAVLRKLIVLANALVAQNRLWVPKTG
jgi:transposase